MVGWVKKYPKPDLTRSMHTPKKIVSLFMSPPFEILNKLLHRPHTDMHLNFIVDIVCTYFVVLLTIGSVGPKDLASPACFISNPRPTPRKRKCLRMNNEGLRLLWGFAEDHPVLGKPGSLKEEAAHPQKRPSLSSQR